MTHFKRRKKLKTPTILANPDGTRSLVWVMPGEVFAERFIEILWEEAQVPAKAKPVDKFESVVSAEYSELKAPFVIFAVWLFHEFYKQTQSLEKLLELEVESAP